MPLVYTLWQRNAKKNQHLVVKIQQAAANKIICSSTCFFFFKEPADKKKGKKTGKATTVVPGIHITSRTLWTTTNSLDTGPAAKGRDNEGQMRCSHVCFFGLVATCDVPGTCPTQKLPLFFNLIQMGHEKTNLVFRRSPDRGGIVLTSSKKTKTNMIFCISTTMPATYRWYVPRVTYVQKFHPTQVVVHSHMRRSVVSLSCVVVEDVGIM